MGPVVTKPPENPDGCGEGKARRCLAAGTGGATTCQRARKKGTSGIVTKIKYLNYWLPRLERYRTELGKARSKSNCGKRGKQGAAAEARQETGGVVEANTVRRDLSYCTLTKLELIEPRNKKNNTPGKKRENLNHFIFHNKRGQGPQAGTRKGGKRRQWPKPSEGRRAISREPLQGKRGIYVKDVKERGEKSRGGVWM